MLAHNMQEATGFLSKVKMKQLYIADDNEDFAQYLSTVAQQGGWVVNISSNGKELIENLQDGCGPAFVLIDINMPEMDGIEAIEGIVDIDRPLRIRFITGGQDSTIIAARMIASARSLEVGRSIYKPISMESFKTLLAEEIVALGSLRKDAGPV